MKKAAELFRRLFCLPLLPTVLISIPGFALVSYVLAGQPVPLAVDYLAYVLSAYALTLTVTAVVRTVRRLRQGAPAESVQRFAQSRFGSRYLGDSVFRTQVSLYAGLAVNVLYALFKLITGICSSSLWFGALAGYYLLLALMRSVLLQPRKAAAPTGEHRRCLACGVLLLVMDLALTVLVALMIAQGKSGMYPGFLIYAMAAYTFYIVIKAAIDLVRLRRSGSPQLQAVKTVSLTAAMVTLLSLETAMLDRFGGPQDILFRQKMVGVTGAAVCLLVVCLAVHTICSACSGLRKISLQTEEN